MDPDNLRPQKTFWMYFRDGLVKAHARRPTSFYLLLLIPVVLLLGAGVFSSFNTPRQFAFYLSLIFLVFFLIEINRRHFAEREKLFRNTLGDAEFATRLGERVKQERNK